MALNPKQERFAAEYLIDLNATQAAIRAGYSAKTAYSQGERLLRHVEVAQAVQAGQKARAVRIAFFDIRQLYRPDGTMKDPSEMDADTAAALASIEVREELERGTGDEEADVVAPGGAVRRKRGELVGGYTIKTRVFDKVATLQLAMRHLGMLNDKLGLSAPGGGPIETVSRVTRTIIDPKA